MLNRRTALLSWIGLKGLAGQTLTTTSGLNRERRDFTVVTSADTFPVKFPPRNGVIDVFRNGLLQTQGIDYTQAPAAGVLTVTFVAAANLQPGDLVSLFYWT